jgi:hypothetical protein
MKKYLLNLLFTVTATFMGAPSSASPTVEEIHVSIKKGRFLPSEINIPADTKVKLTIENFDDTPEEFESYDLNREVLINPGGKASFYIGPLSIGSYKFEGEFSPETAHGIVRVK